MIGQLERQIQIWDGTGDVWRGRIIERIRKTIKARIEKEREKRVERTEGYSNDKDVLRQEFGIVPEVDGLEASGGLEDAQRGACRVGLQCDQGANLGVFYNVALLREPADGPSQVEEADLVKGNAPINVL